MSWAEQDNLVGVNGYDVEFKLGAGSWTSWLSNTRETEAEFSGMDGQRYTLRVRAVDRVGNVSS